MNKQILKEYIARYKENFEIISQKEIYKWQAVKCFQDNWNLDSDNFSDMLAQSLSKTKNLLNAGQYFPLRMITQYAEKKPIEVKALFVFLYDEKVDLYYRIKTFKEEINKINNLFFADRKSYQDDRAVIVYLVLRYPERYFFYKFTMFKNFAKKVDFLYKPIQGRLENIGQFQLMCEMIQHELSLDQELLKLHTNRIAATCYYDDKLTILTQDFVYAVDKYLNQEANLLISRIHTPVLNLSKTEAHQLLVQTPSHDFRGKFTNFTQNEIENKRIGDLGELLVMQYEKEKLLLANKPQLAKKISHTAKDKGDGTGFDIQSFNENGTEIYIEVKTTKGPKDTSFFVTSNELQRSRKEQNNYYLYRLYDFNEKENHAKLLIIQGDLASLCIQPIVYKIDLKE